MGTKNNPKNRGKGSDKKRMYNGREVEPALYYGVHAGHGKYVACKYAGSDEMACDESGKPVAWDSAE